MWRASYLCIVFSVSVLLSSCQPTKISSIRLDEVTKKQITKGLGIYFLPMTLVTVKLNRIDTYKTCYETNKKRKVISKNKTNTRFEPNLSKIIVPDGEFNYLIEYKKSPSSKDKITIDLTTSGLLDKIHFQSEEATDEIILKVVEIAKSIAMVPGDKVRELEKKRLKEPNCLKEDETDTVFTITFDPLSLNGLDVINDALEEIDNETLKFEIKEPHEDYKLSVADTSSCNDGICYRPLKLYDLVLNRGEKEYFREALLLHAKDTISSIDLSGSMFVDKTVTIDFEDGSLKQVDIEKPSEALEIISLPFNILHSIISLPTELIQFKIDTTNKEKELIEANKNNIETQRLLIEAQEELRNKQKEINERRSKSNAPPGVRN